MRSLLSRLLLLFYATAFYSSGTAVMAETILPNSVQDNCSFSYSKNANGSFPAPDNMHFGDDVNGTPSVCDFYNRSLQMFIWLTSPASPRYAGGRYVFTSSIFNPVSTPQDGVLHLMQGGDAIASAEFLDVTLSQTGSKGFPVVFDTSGAPHELVYPKFVRTGPSEPIEIARAKLSLHRLPVLFDKNNKQVKLTNESKLLDGNSNEIISSGKTIVTNGVQYETDLKNDAIVYGPGQAGTGKVLMSQNGKIVYYGILINDVYAAFHASSPDQPPTEFPTKIDGLGGPFPDADALAVAIKTAWVEVEESEKPEYQKKYLLIETKIPTYKIQSDYVWIPAHMPKSATLALVAMHVAFSAKNQSKMIWVTFESIHNTRNRDYDYFDKAGKLKTKSVDTGQKWLFSNPSNQSINVSHMYVDSKTGQIVGDTENSIQMKIGPSNIRRAYPWGADHKLGNMSDTDIISINKNAAGQLAADDVRRQYIMRGANWFASTTEGVQGVLKLANSTMETFIPDSNCLGCHTGNALSHIWGKLSPARR